MHYKAKVFFLALLLLALAGAAQAETIFPVVSTFTYDAQAGDASWTSTVTFTSTATMKLMNWNSPSEGEVTVPVSLTAYEFYINEGQGLQLYFTTQKTSWDFTADDGSSGTATVQSIGPLDLTVNGQSVTYDEVYKVYYATNDYSDTPLNMDADFYWKPGLGLLKVEDRGLDPDTTHTLTAYATPLPAGVWLLGSGLLGLAALRRFRKR